MSQIRLTESWKESRLARLVKRAGTAVHLVPDTLLATDDIINYLPASNQAYITSQELEDAVVCLVRDQPLLSALQDARAAAAAVQCQRCQPAEPPRLAYVTRSGSMAEGVSDGFIGGKNITSDFDIMLELGPLRWAAQTVSQAEPDVISPEEAPQLWAKPTNNPGFVTLHWARTTQCRHEAPLEAMPAHSVRQLMLDHCRAWFPADHEITPTGPAVNVLPPNAPYGGIDYVPCLRLPWWPEQEAFLSRHRQTDFPSEAARREICRFGTHLVPIGHPDSSTEDIEYRVSFSRAEVVSVRQLTTTQHATIRATKAVKKHLKNSGAELPIKSYFIKTAVLWLAQDKSSDSWTGVTAGVHMVLDWLEQHLNDKNLPCNIKDSELPCFFWHKINLVASLSRAELEGMIKAVQLMRIQATPLLMACCEDGGWDLDGILGEGTDPLPERELRIRLARRLGWGAVTNGTIFRPAALCWESWMARYIPGLGRADERRLLQWVYRRDSGTYWQQCYLLQALAVAPADLVSGMQLTSLGGDMFTWPVTPLLNLLTESDLEHLLGDPAAVAAWCRQQLCLPPAERPAGLTAELDTPRGRAELLLQPELRLRAFSEAVPRKRVWWQRKDQETAEEWAGNYCPPPTFQQRQRLLEGLLSCDLESWLRRDLPELDGPTVAATARLWRRRLEHLLSGDRLWRQYTAVTTRWPDRWQLLQFYLQRSPTEGKTRRRHSLLTHRHTSHVHCTAQWEHKARHLQQWLFDECQGPRIDLNFESWCQNLRGLLL